MAVADLGLLSDALAEKGEVDALDTVSVLLTVDAEGYPFVCLLTSRQLTVRGGRLAALVQSRRTKANLERTGRATLHLVHDGASVLVGLRLVSSLAIGDTTLFTFEVSQLQSERRSSVLTPILYQLDEGILAREGPSVQEVLDERGITD